MTKKMKLIQVPNGLVSNEFREDGIKISPRTTYLYVWIKLLITDYKTNKLIIRPIELRKHLGWTTNVMLKSHLKILKDLKYITYQDELDNGKLSANISLKIEIFKVKTQYAQLTAKTIREEILTKVDSQDKALRICLLYQYYTNKDYGYCWLTFRQIEDYGGVKMNSIDLINKQLESVGILKVSRGVHIKDDKGYTKKENNKYIMMFK